MTHPATLDNDVDELITLVRDDNGDGTTGVHLALRLATTPRTELARALGAAILRLAAQPDPTETPAAPDVDLTAAPPDAFTTFTADQIVALDRLATTMHGHHWRIDLWTPHGVLHATPARPTTKETNQ